MSWLRDAFCRCDAVDRTKIKISDDNAITSPLQHICENLCADRYARLVFFMEGESSLEYFLAYKGELLNPNLQIANTVPDGLTMYKLYIYEKVAAFK